MNTPRENDPYELERFKQNIDLVDYATRQGYAVKKEGRNGNWHQLEKGDETLIVTKKDDHQVYLNTGNDRDSGSVIDFAKTRANDGQGLNLGQVRQELRSYLSEAPAPTRIYAEAVDVAKLNALPVGPEQERQQQEERKTQLIAEVLGVNKELTDRSYLHGRGIEDTTIDAAAFKGRIFTAQQNEHKNTAFPLYNEQGLASVEQKNENYKNLLPLPKNGIWVSHPTEGKDTQVTRIVVSESAIDSLSHYQLKQEQKNTIYIATSGTPTEAQVALIQRVIDKQAPKEIVLANDRDNGGRQFNINYLNELHPARPLVPIADQEAYREASRPIEWHATSDKYHTGLKVTYHHESTEQGRPQVEQLTQRVASMNNMQEAGPSVHLEVQRSTERETIVRLSVAKGDTAQLEVISQELYRQREQLRPAQERQAEAFIRVEYPIAKDWNRDLELLKQGLTVEQVREQALREERERQAEREQRLAQQQAEREKQREAERQRENTPEAQKQRAEEERRLANAVIGLAVAEATLVRADGQRQDTPPGTERAPTEPARDKEPQRIDNQREEVVAPAPPTQEAPPRIEAEQQTAEPVKGSEKELIIRIDEVAPTPGSRGQAEAVKEAVAGSGARTGDVQSTVDSQGIRHSEIKVAYHTDQPEIANISRTIDAVARQNGNQVLERDNDRGERHEAAKRHEMPTPSRSQEITR